ncbi:MAG: metal ABC transporter substrate-binding protein [Fibrobacterota bacterium]
MRLNTTALLLMFCTVFTAWTEKITIGVALRPYYSFAENIARDRAEVVSLTDGVNPHSYKATTKDITRIKDLDVVILNGIGHDDFAEEMLNAAGIIDSVTIIYANDNVPLIPQSVNTDVLNSHTFVSISTSISQIYEIARRLGEADPENADYYRKNAGEYTQKLRKLKFKYLKEVNKIGGTDISCATTHGGYSYLLQEFGITVNAVLEPSHGLKPSASKLKGIINIIEDRNIKIVFSENDYADPFIKILEDETDITAIPLSHLSAGDFSADHFEKWMEFNLQQVVKALKIAKGATS